MYNPYSHEVVEHARMRYEALQKAAEKARLLQQLGPTERFLWIRRIGLATGNGLIAGGLWLKQRAALEQEGTYRQPMSGNFSRAAGK
jgi:hypothetical protein